MDNSQGRLQDFREYIEKIFLQEPELYAFDSVAQNCPPVASFTYENVPEDGYITAVTFGVSEFNNPDWVDGRPELTLSVKSMDLNWGKVLAYIGANLIDEYTFEYGEIINFDSKIAEDSEMTCFFIFAPSILDPEDYESIAIEKRKINLVALYPIYKEEIDVIAEIGLQNFMSLSEYDMYDIKRPNLGNKKKNSGDWLPPDWNKN